MAKNTATLQIDPLKQGRVTLRVIGTTPLYYNSMSFKVKKTLVAGGRKKTVSERAQLKHNPEEEFRDSIDKQSAGDTLLCMSPTAFKGAMSTAALETAGVTKSSVKRLIFIPHQKINIWGKPYLKMDVVRSADINKTPDVRTRAFLPRWCAEIDIAFVMPNLSTHSVVSLMQNAGVVVGVGDFRQEKGAGNYGSFSVHGTEEMGADATRIWNEIVTEARDIQVAAMDDPEPYDDETAELLEFISDERARREAA